MTVKLNEECTDARDVSIAAHSQNSVLALLVVALFSFRNTKKGINELTVFVSNVKEQLRERNEHLLFFERERKSEHRFSLSAYNIFL